MPQANNSSTPSKAVETRFFSVADLAFAISFAGYDDGFRMLKSFRPFERKTADKGSLLFTLTIDDSTRPVAKERRERIREFETGNGTTIVDRLQDGGYQYIIKDINALSRPSSRKGRMEKPFNGKVTVWPSPMSLNTSGKKSALLNVMVCFMTIPLYALIPRYALVTHFRRIPVGQAMEGVHWHAFQDSRYRAIHIPV